MSRTCGVWAPARPAPAKTIAALRPIGKRRRTIPLLLCELFLALDDVARHDCRLGLHLAIADIDRVVVDEYPVDDAILVDHVDPFAIGGDRAQQALGPIGRGQRTPEARTVLAVDRVCELDLA